MIRFPLTLLALILSWGAPLSLHAGDPVLARTALLKNSEYCESLLQGIREARSSVIGSFYLFRITGSRDNLPRRIADELARAARRGVAVTVILERGPDGGDRLNIDNRETAAYLSEAGVRVRFDSPDVVTHAKVVVIDGRFVYLGSHNLTQSALRHNNELSVRIDSPGMAAEVVAYLQRL